MLDIGKAAARLVGFALTVPHGGIDAAFLEQLVVAAALDDAPCLEHDDLVGIDHGRQAMGDDQSGAVARHLAERALDFLLGQLSSAEVASSRTRIGGPLRMVRAIDTRCFSPPDSLRPRSPTSVS